MSVVNKIKLPNNTTVDINDARDVIIGDGVENVVILTSAQYDALATKDPNTLYLVTDRNVPASSGGGGGTTVSWGTESGYTVPLTVDGVSKTICLDGYSAGGSDITTAELVGSMNRTDVSGSGNLTVKNTSGAFPTVTAGTYIVKTFASSTTANYTLSVSFGGQTYSLTSSNGLIDDSRELTFSSSATWSGSITTVNSSTTLIVSVYSEGSIVTTVGIAAVSNDYQDLDNKPSIPTESTVSGWGFTKNVGTLTGVTFNGTSATVTSGVAAITATIPTVPTISTNITTDATSDTKTASPKAVKTYVDGIVGDIETLLAAI